MTNIYTVVPRIAIAPFNDEIALRWTKVHRKSDRFAMAPMGTTPFAMIAGERSPTIMAKAPLVSCSKKMGFALLAGKHFHGSSPKARFLEQLTVGRLGC